MVGTNPGYINQHDRKPLAEAFLVDAECVRPKPGAPTAALGLISPCSVSTYNQIATTLLHQNQFLLLLLFLAIINNQRISAATVEAIRKKSYQSSKKLIKPGTETATKIITP
ncbi:hypothetical protein [Rathayibacter toxicus]|uniref:hypothetical protein n=1 Tax=Rathayibacter toxicus TaxID=145458 RepID=UPI001C051773|nr:hypothetical protein [Rathayibacter toxicus]QWL27327.1 hypothetical protein E2R33_00890 [Rathayibacter toxicus]QWL29455.1 hypothetical protein E2R34_00855 [Rathayibacter toxicus]QWL31543.1 hypothetical protein E2R35_00860 [Rathayibacter toxicus]QWL33635.1 hypothetical protein E2R36_00860 [Rathayibacter toxicus]QWL35770.1 hypothetical protein E2R37_00860 [Rathayibacter toxicus]